MFGVVRVAEVFAGSNGGNSFPCIVWWRVDQLLEVRGFKCGELVIGGREGGEGVRMAGGGEVEVGVLIVLNE